MNWVNLADWVLHLPQHKLQLVAFAISLISINVFLRYWRLRKFRGPFFAGFSGIPHSRAILNLNAHVFYGEVTKKYGPIARVDPNHLVTSSPELWARINAARTEYSRAAWYYHAIRFEPGKDNIVTQIDNKKHEERRKQMATGYSGKENPRLESAIDSHVKQLVHLIRSKYVAKKGPVRLMDLAKKFQYFTLDVITDVGLGNCFGNVSADADVDEYIKSLEEGMLIATISFGLGLGWLREVPGLGKLLGPSEKDEKGFGKMMGLARKHVQDRLQHPTDKRSDMLASFIRHGLTGDELFSETFEQILAGSDTTASALRVIMLYTMTNPRVYVKLQAEIDAAVRNEKSPSQSAILNSETGELPYLKAVVREALRIHPPVVNIFSKAAPKGGDTFELDGRSYHIPEGTYIGYAAWGMHRDNVAVYGEDAHVFRPERWLIPEDDLEGQERLAQMIKTNDMVFGYGKWQCLGKTVAMIEIHKAIFELLRNFDFALANPEKPWKKIDVLGLFAMSEMWVQVTER